MDTQYYSQQRRARERTTKGQRKERRDRVLAITVLDLEGNEKLELNDG